MLTDIERAVKGRSQVSPAEPFRLHSQRLGCLPIVNFFLDRMGLAEQLAAYLPTDDPRLRLAPAR